MMNTPLQKQTTWPYPFYLKCKISMKAIKAKDKSTKAQTY